MAILFLNQSTPRNVLIQIKIGDIGDLRERKRNSFSGDRYVTTCRVSFECHNETCPYLIEFKKINWGQFSTKGHCKNCGHHSKRTPCESRKFWKVLFSVEKVSVKHFDQHTCSPMKPRHEREIAEAVKKHPAKLVSKIYRFLKHKVGKMRVNVLIQLACMILDEKRSNWKAVENVYGKELLHRCYSWKFHFKKSVKRRLKDPTFNNQSPTKFQFDSKQMLESSNKANFESSIFLSSDMKS